MGIAVQVNNILYDSLFKPEELIQKSLGNSEPKEQSQMIKVIGISNGFGFHKDRLENHREEIKLILLKMSEKFHKSAGGGWSFLNLPFDKGGNHWGEHIHCESLFALASGLGMAKFVMPRESWDIFPSGIPYIVFDVEGKLQ